MRAATRKVLWGVLSVFAGILVFVAIGMSPVTMPSKSHLDVSMTKVRELALSTREPLPMELRSLRVAVGGMPRLMIVAGGGFRNNPLSFYSYQIVYPGRTVIIDAVGDEATMRASMSSLAEFQTEHYARMQDAMRRADAIAVTHEHFDHCTGISQSPFFAEIAARVMMTEEQLASREMPASKFTPEVQRGLRALRYEGMHLLGAGLVLIKAPGHTPGTQMVYLRLQDSTEFLLVGDIAWHMDNVRLPRAHPRMINWVAHEDGNAMAHQLRYLHDLMIAEPNLHIVVAHDGEQMDEYIHRGLVKEGFH